MLDEETGLELEEEAEGQPEAGREEPEERVEEPEEGEGEQPVKKKAAKKDAREAVRLNKAPWINRRMIFMTLAGITAIVTLISIIPGNKGKKGKGAKTKNAPEVTVPDFGDYRGRAYRAEAGQYPERFETIPAAEEAPVPYYEPPPQRQQPAPPSRAGSSSGRNAAAEAEYAARASSLIPPIQGRLIGMPSGGYAGGYVAAPAQGGILSPEEYMRDRLSALGAGAYNSPANALPPPAGMGGSTSYETQNMQANKQAFYTEGRGGETGGLFIGEDSVWNGTIVPAVLITGINTDLPGDVQARVTTNIFDSLTGKKLLIPQGTVLIASYNSSVSFAQERVQIAWNTLIRPDGYQVELGNMNGVDRRGFSGTRGQINDHLFQYVKAAGIISAFTLLNGEISYNSASANNPALQNLIATNQGVVNQLSAEIINRALDIQPTLTVKNGTQVNVMINKNIRLPPLKDYPVSGTYRRR